MKILFVINTLGHAGAEVALLELLFELVKRGYKPQLYVMLAQGELADRLPEGVTLLNKDYKNISVLSAKGRLALIGTVLKCMLRNGHVPARLGALARELGGMLKKRHVQFDKLLWRVVSDGAKRPTEQYDLAVAYLEGASTYFVADYVQAAKKAAFVHIDYESAGYTRKLDKNCYLTLDRIFAVSDEVRDKFVTVYPECAARTRVFHNIVNQEKIRAQAENPGGFTDGFYGIRLMTVGRLTHQKAYDIAIRAMKLLKDDGVCARWYVFGEGAQRAALQKQIAALGLTDDFLLMGAVDQPFPYYKQCDIYVHATRFEGKSIAIQEAQTLGCAIVASDCPGNREQLTDGVDGLFCELTPEDIAAKIKTLASDRALRQRLGRAAAEKTLANEKELEQLLELL